MNYTEATKRAYPVIGVLFSDSPINKVYFYLCRHADVRKGDYYQVDTPHSGYDKKKVKVVWTSTNCSDQEKIDQAYAMTSKVLDHRIKRGPKPTTGCATYRFKHIGSNAIIQDSGFWSVDPFKFNTNQETNDMSSALKVKIETITFLNDSPLRSYADSALVEMIDKLETKARDLARIQTKSTRIAAEITRLNEDAATLAKYLDERDGS